MDKTMNKTGIELIAQERKEQIKARISTSKTFQKGDDYGELIEWFMKQIETHDWQPEGTEWSGGQPGPMDPVCELIHKYVITVKKLPQ